MRIVIDLQGAQSSSSRNRGVGRYSLALALAIARNRGNHEVILALNGQFPDSVEHVKAIFQDVLPQENIHIWHSPDSLNYSDASNAWRRKAAELTREAFLAHLNPSVLLITSLFEGRDGDAVTSLGSLAKAIPTAVILYDLIPLINRSHYLDNPITANWYDEKIGYLRCAHQLLAISESSREEGIKYLGIPANSIANISTAADPQFRVRHISKAKKAALCERYAIEHSFVMYTGGIDHRKNIEGLIRAYADLSTALRRLHQLVVVCSIQPYDRNRLEMLAKQHGLAPNELIMTGYVPEADLVDLYNLCKVFVFPSWHEGFGLPVLEAMSCGRAVICANTSSLPEVIGCNEAMFDPHDDSSISRKLEQVLTDGLFRSALEQHGLEQSKKFTWDKTAQAAISVLEVMGTSQPTNNLPSNKATKPRLAYVSPLPPERSGISDYSAELIPELIRYYDIEVIVAQDIVASPWVNNNCPIRTVEWFCDHATEFDRVLYHFGNSAYHKHMFSLLENVPGVVVLHDFFLSDIISHREIYGGEPGVWVNALYTAHGYSAVQQRFNSLDTQDIVCKYPCNYSVLEHAQGVIVHSDNSRQLAKDWYGESAGRDWALVPLLRVPNFSDKQSRKQLREELGLDEQDFVVCSFGLLGPNKLNHRLLQAWLDSVLGSNHQCKLIFVGENETGAYGQSLLANIKSSKYSSRIQITGWADTDIFRQYLVVADVAVQLRALSRGETSAAVLDCMNYGLATIVNTNGSMADLPDDGVWKISDEFCDTELVDALTALWQDIDQRHELGKRAKQHILTQHNPETCAEQYQVAIECFHSKYITSIPSLVRAIAEIECQSVNKADCIAVAEAIDRSIVPVLKKRQLLIDVSLLIQDDLSASIKQVVHSVLKDLLLNPVDGYRLEPIYTKAGRQDYYYARGLTLSLLNCPENTLEDAPVSYRQLDVLIQLGLQSNNFDLQEEIYSYLANVGVRVKSIYVDQAFNAQQLRQQILAI